LNTTLSKILPRANRPLVRMESGELKLAFHPGQVRVWESEARFILVLAGTRSGKSSFSPWWLWREIEARGAGDYLLCAPSYKLLDKAAVPYLNEAFSTYLGLGRLVGRAQGCFEVSEAGEWSLWEARQDKPTRILFGHADEPESLEAAQYKAAVCDEAGQKRFKQESWEAIQRRLAIDRGRCLFPTTPYSLNWLKTEVHDRAVRNLKGTSASPTADAGYDLVSFESIMNPAFPLDEWERAKATLPAWKFDLFYRGIFSRPAGAIYDCFDPDFHVIPADFEPPATWRVFCGIDFGSPNFAAVFIAEEPGTGKRVVFAEYRPKESRKIEDNIAAMHAVMRKAFRLHAAQWAAMADRSVNEWTRLPDLCIGGAKSEGSWRSEYGSRGWPIREPDQPEVEVGISRVYSTFAEDRLFISAACPLLISEITNYSREVDDDGEPISDTIMDKDTFHGADSLRYIVGYLEAKGTGLQVWTF
jgi:hypothetical protein